ncbi:MAG TPA: SpoIIE family protein phosphatase [Spirochaetota bacterium]|nr:SpoIIE family protein phosphatase [Spirochaetota bacterium]
MTDGSFILPERYRNGECCHEDRLCSAYIFHDASFGGERRLVKIFKNEGAAFSLDNFIRFKSEIKIALRLKHSNLLQVVDFGETAGCVYIVWEYVEGTFLNTILKQPAFFSIEETLQIVASLCSALVCLHDNGIIHRHINPAKIIVPDKQTHKSFHQVKLIDTGISHLVKNGHTYNDEGESFPLYFSPEQVDSNKGMIDQRSDIYSLGILLFYLLTGDYPFERESGEKSVARAQHSFLDKKRKLLSNFPSILERIVLKMIEVDPLKRYQSSISVAHDLDLYMRGYRDFMLAEHDGTVRHSFTAPLIGMKEEFNLLKRMYKNTMKKNGGLCLISGAAGTGKTFLAEELGRYVAGKTGFYVSRKFYQSGEPVPYAPFREVISIYVDFFKQKPEWEKREIVARIKKEFYSFGEILYQFNPAIKEILGGFPKLIELEPDRETQRYLMIVARLFRVISEIEKAMVLYLGNIHLIDEGSLLLLFEILQTINDESLFIIGSYRNDEISKDHILNRLFDRGKTGQYTHNEIRLKPFNDELMQKYITAILSQESAEVVQFANSIQKKSKGIPYFASIIIKDLIKEGAVYFSNNRWNFDYNKVETLNIPAGIQEIILQRASLLSEREKVYLQTASVMGKSVDLELLAEVLHDVDTGFNDFNSGYSDEDLINTIDHALDLQIFEQDKQKGTLFFINDQVRDYFYTSLNAEQRRNFHLLFADNILQKDIRENDTIYFNLAYHYNEAQDRENVIKYAFLAGLIAKANYAHDLALSYFNSVSDFIEKDPGFISDENILKKWLACKEETCTIYLTVGEIDKAIELYNIVLPYKKSANDKALIYRQICFAYFKVGNWDMCEEYGRRGLLLLGEKLPIKKIAIFYGIIRGGIVHLLHRLIPLPPGIGRSNSSSDVDRIKIWLYVSTNWMYILSDVAKFVNSIIRMLNISEFKIGKSRELGMSLAAFASMCMAVSFYRLSLKYHDRAIKMRDELNDEWGLGQSYQWVAYCYSWMGNYRKSNEAFIRSLNIFKSIGDLWEIGMVYGGLSYNYYLSSNYDKSISYSREYRIISMKLNDYYGLSRCYQYLALSILEKGDFESAEDYLNQSLQICLDNKINFNLCVNHVAMGMLYGEKGDFDRALVYYTNAQRMIKENNFIREYVAEAYNGIAECLLRRLIEEKSFYFKVKNSELLELRRACRIALRATRSLKSHHGKALRLYAEYHAAINITAKAEKLYLQSIETLDSAGRQYELAKSFLSYGLFLERSGRSAESKKKLESAKAIFSEIGAQEYITLVSKKLGVESDVYSDPSGSYDQQRLSSIITLSQDISSVLDLNNLFEQILSKAVEETGAQRGYLFLKNAEGDDLELISSINLMSSDDVEYSRHIVDDVFKTGKRLLTTNAEGAEKYSLYQSIIRRGLKSVLCLPIMYYDKLTGICYLDNPLKRGAFSEQDGVMMEVLMGQAGIAIENANFYNDLEKKVRERTRELNHANEELGNAYNTVNEAYQIIKEDLSMAQIIQRGMLPQNLDMPGLDFNIYFYPVSEVGGDIYDITSLNSERVRVFICDATGHGIQAALVTMIIKSEYDSIKETVSDPSELLNKLNRSICRNYHNLQIIFTCAVIDIFSLEGRMLFSCAGHAPQYLISNDSIISLEKTGRIVGLMESSVYTLSEFKINPGDRIIALTDGLYEQFNDNRVAYGEQRMVDVIARNKNRDVDEIINILFKDVSSFIGPDKNLHQDDDTTVIGITITSTL